MVFFISQPRTSPLKRKRPAPAVRTSPAGSRVQDRPADASILFDATRPVKPAARPFGAGLLPPGPPSRPFEPSPEDRAWWAAESSPPGNRAAGDARFDAMAAESAALGMMEAGIRPF